jgi:hypothetical protein
MVPKKIRCKIRFCTLSADEPTVATQTVSLTSERCARAGPAAPFGGMDASTIDAVADALRALLRDPAFQRLDGSFAAAFEDEHASAAQERFEAYAREVRPLVETKVRDVVEEYDFDALASAIARREDPNEIAAHDSTFQLLASTRDVSHFATRARSRRRHLRGRDDDDDAAFGVETMSVEEHERREAALERETEDGDERPDLEDLLVVTRAACR